MLVLIDIITVIDVIIVIITYIFFIIIIHRFVMQLPEIHWKEEFRSL